ncbi:zinc finger protein 436-like isoform X2 [Engraulis encrasicolus]|uniref:zinc finger protein 436-like isoform X2 n=1 Tax=Engraulis encrasicolus TaxID=184585 RepID=UPI002FD14066
MSTFDVKEEDVEVNIDEEEVIADGADASMSDHASEDIEAISRAEIEVEVPSRYELDVLQEQGGEAVVKEVPSQCKKCRKMLPNARRLQEHHREFHTKRPFTCPQCLKGFFTKGNLKTHLDNHGVMPYRCSRCPQGFWKQGYLMTHERTHLFNCKQCDKSFTKIGYLFRHQKTHTEDEPYLR